MKVIVIITVFAIWALAIVGWVLNIVQLINDTYLLNMFVLKIVGIFVAPLGAVLGYIG